MVILPIQHTFYLSFRRIEFSIENLNSRFLFFTMWNKQHKFWAYARLVVGVKRFYRTRTQSVYLKITNKKRTNTILLLRGVRIQTERLNVYHYASI